MAETKYYRVTKKELLSLTATADSCNAIGGDLDDEAKRAIAAIKAIEQRHGGDHHRVTEGELFALIATADSCNAMGGGLEDEAKRAKKAIKAIGKRHGVDFIRNYSDVEVNY